MGTTAFYIFSTFSSITFYAIFFRNDNWRRESLITPEKKDEMKDDEENAMELPVVINN